MEIAGVYFFFLVWSLLTVGVTTTWKGQSWKPLRVGLLELLEGGRRSYQLGKKSYSSIFIRFLVNDAKRF